MRTAPAPQPEQEEEVGEEFFGAQHSPGDFIDDGDDDELPGTESGSPKQREEAETRVTGWCNGDAMRVDGSMTIVTADTLGQMPHGRWRSCTAMGMPSGISYVGASPWTAQISRCDGGVNLGMTKFRPTASVYDGTGEELVWRLIALLEGTHTETSTSDSGVVSHLVRSSQRVDRSTEKSGQPARGARWREYFYNFRHHLPKEPRRALLLGLCEMYLPRAGRAPRAHVRLLCEEVCGFVRPLEPSTVRPPLARGPRVLVGWPLPLALGFWYGLVLATDTAWAGLCLIHHHQQRGDFGVFG